MSLKTWRKVWKIYLNWWRTIASPYAKAMWIMSMVTLTIPLMNYLIPYEMVKNVVLAIIVLIDACLAWKVHVEIKQIFDDIEFVEKVAED
jgi:hypothetical protein